MAVCRLWRCRWSVAQQKDSRTGYPRQKVKIQIVIRSVNDRCFYIGIALCHTFCGTGNITSGHDNEQGS